MRLEASIVAVAVLALAPQAIADPPSPKRDEAFDAELAALIGVPGGLTADQAAARAPRASPDVLDRVADVAAATADAKRAELARAPRATASLTYTRLSSVDPPMLAPGVSFPVLFNSYAASAQVAVPLSDYLLTFPSLIAAARTGADAARYGERAARIDAAHAARVAYYEWARARLQVVVAKRQVVQVEAVRAQLAALVSAQRVSQADLLRLDAQKAQAEQGVAATEALLAVREEQLRQAIGAEPDEPLAIGDDVRVALPAPATATAEELVRQASAQRLDVQLLDAGLRALEHKRRSGRSGQWPRLAAFAQVDYANPNQRVFPVQEQFDLTWAAGVSLSWSLTDHLGALYTKDRDTAEIDGLRAQRARLGQGIRLQIAQATTAVSLADRALRSAQAQLVAAEEGYRVRSLLLANERATVVEIVDAEVQLTQARFALINAHIDQRVAHVQFDHAIGADAKGKQ